MKVDELKGIELDMWFIKSQGVKTSVFTLVKMAIKAIFSRQEIDYNYIWRIIQNENIIVEIGNTWCAIAYGNDSGGSYNWFVYTELEVKDDRLTMLKRCIIKSVYGEEVE